MELHKPDEKPDFKSFVCVNGSHQADTWFEDAGLMALSLAACS